MSGLEEPIPMLSRLNRLDNILRQLEDIQSDQPSPKSSYSYASTTSSGTLTSDGHPWTGDFSPERLEKHCRPVNEVMMEVEQKGTLIERLVHELEELEGERSKEQRESPVKKSPRKGLKQLVKSCVGVKPNHKRHA